MRRSEEEEEKEGRAKKLAPILWAFKKRARPRWREKKGRLLRPLLWPRRSRPGG